MGTGCLPERVAGEIVALAEQYGARKLVLFGSRARGDSHEKSDIDLAVYGCRDFVNLALDLDEKTWTLLSFDVVNMDGRVSPELAQEIERDGVLLYEKV